MRSGSTTGRGCCRRCATPDLGIRTMALNEKCWEVVALHGRVHSCPLRCLGVHDLNCRSIRQPCAVLWILKAVAHDLKHQGAVRWILHDERTDVQQIGREQARDAPLLLGAPFALPRFQSLANMTIVHW